ncbi:MAG: hypothetical protein IPM69_04805 [Ignavibacteria bacterium]|nr:hypothetical protein [Ignavibacteria bacterium]
MDTNSTSSFLHAFLDGELDQAHEKALFDELASSNDLRSEMKDLLTLRSAVQHDVEAFSPPYAATNNVFSTLGFTPPTSSPLAVPTPIIPSGAATLVATTWWSRLWLPATTLLVGAGLMYLLLDMRHTSALATKEAEYNVTMQNIQVENSHAIALAKDNERRAIEKAIAEPQIIIKKVFYPVIKYRDALPINPSDGSLNSQEFPVNSSSQFTNNTVVISSASMRTVDESEKNSAINALENNTNTVFFASSVSSDLLDHLPLNGGYSDKDLDLEQDTPALWFKISQNTTTLGSTISTNLQPQQAILNNFNGEIAWAISPTISIGAKIGREAFPMIYSGVTNNRISRYEQYSNLVWGGISAQFRPTEVSFLGGIQPYFSTLVGGSELGPLVRGELGLQFPLSSHFSISAGTDATGMFYQFLNTNFSTWKFGLNTGVTFNF